MRECHSAGPVVWTLEPSESTAIRAAFGFIRTPI